MSLIFDSRQTWSFADRSPFPWVKIFTEKVSQIDLPDLSGPWLYVTSDTSGTSRESRFIVTTFLIADMEHSREWEPQRRQVRKDYLADGRRMSFKALNDRQRRSALVPFLTAADHIKGFCLSIVIDKRIHSLCIDKGFIEDNRFPHVFEGKWNLRTLENMLRVAHFFSLLIAGLSKVDQHVYWISDDDDFFATPERTRDTQRVISNFTSLYVTHKLGNLGFGTTAIDEEDRADEDLAAIPDLVAGSTCEAMTAMLKHYGRIPAVPTVLETRISQKSDLITSWFFNSQSRLKKAAYIFEYRAQNHFRMGTFASG
jgi:hypothetical protein